MRKGPHPLSVHIGMAASSFPAAKGMREGEFSGVMRKMLLGIRAYQLHPFEPKRLPLHILWKSGEVTVKSTKKKIAQDNKAVLLLVPSLVNRAYILDLMKERSLLRWLEGQGIATYLLDWGEPVKDKKMKDVTAAVKDKLIPAIKFLAKETGAPVHALGYCMGGTLLAGAAMLEPRSIKSLVFLAAPWDFHAGSKALLNRVKFWNPSAAPQIADRGYLPVDWMQTVFASLDPEATAKKFSNFGAMDMDSLEARIFVAVEDWLNDGVDLPAELAREPIEEWFLENVTAKGKWKLGGRLVKPQQIKTPALILASTRDRLVEFDTAKALAKQIKGARVIDAACGHIGMMAGTHAVEKAWQPIAEWVKANN